jgi:heme-degrading monooxygenase HmoA
LIIVLFRSKLTSRAGEDYRSLLAAMDQYAKTQPGFIAQKAFTAEDGERLTIVWWSDKETLDQWRRNQRHIAAKTLGRERWYEYYKMELAEVFHSNHFESEAMAQSEQRD